MLTPLTTLRHEAARQRNSGNTAAANCLHLASALLERKPDLTDWQEAASYLRQQADRRDAGGLIANATALRYAASKLTTGKQ